MLADPAPIAGVWGSEPDPRCCAALVQLGKLQLYRAQIVGLWTRLLEERGRALEAEAAARDGAEEDGESVGGSCCLAGTSGTLALLRPVVQSRVSDCGAELYGWLVAVLTVLQQLEGMSSILACTEIERK